jgi:Flp pilus assembly protein TadD
MKLWAVLLLSMTLAACATPPVARRAEHLFNDHLFLAPSVRIGAEDVFAISQEMKHFLSGEIAEQLRVSGPQRGLFDALYSKNQLKLEYDSAMTRNASEAFHARSGNCLSLVIMTGAFAKEIGLSVRYQTVFADETWSRSGDIHFVIGHVNLTLGVKQTGVPFGHSDSDLMTIDFLPPKDIRGVRTRVIGEKTIVAMYMSNRAAESLALGQLIDAYWWAREAIRQDPGFLSSYNTLGVIYRRHGNLAEAEQVLTLALESEPQNTRVMANLARVFNDMGRIAESALLTRKLEQMEPNPPFSFFDRGLAAMRNGDFNAARALFANEVDRAGYYHEFHYWLALAYVGLGDIEMARTHLGLAMKNSTTRSDHDLYSAKLARMRPPEPQ